MPSMTVKNLPPRLLQALRAAAESDRRSLNQEIIYLLEAAVRLRTDKRLRRPATVEAQLEAWRALAGKWVPDAEERKLPRTGEREVEF